MSSAVRRAIVARLLLERLAHAVLSAVDGGADADPGPVADEPAGGVDGGHARASSRTQCGWPAPAARRLAGPQSGITTPIVSRMLAYSRCSPVAIARAQSGPRAMS